MPIALLTLRRAAASSSALMPVTAGSGRYGEAGQSGPRLIAGSLAFGIAAVVAVGLALALIAEPPEGRPRTTDVHDVPLPPPPPPRPDPVVEPETQRQPTITTVPPRYEVPTRDDRPIIPFEDADPLPPTPYVGDETGTGELPVAQDPPAPPPAPVLVEARRHPRYLDDFQPPYPARLEREQVEGRARVTVTINAAGRVTAVTDAGSTDPGFFEATRRHALSRWRFLPATRGGEAIESTQTLSVQFRITSAN